MTDKQMLKSICSDIDRITGIKAVIYDTDMKIVYSQPGGMCEFCREIRRSNILAERCRACDRAGFGRCRQSRHIEIYRCHMGLTEAIAPVLDNGIVIGYLLFGQLVEGSKEAIRRQIDRTDGVDRDVLRRALDRMPVTPTPTIEASARLMAMCAGYVRLIRILSIRQNSLAVHIEQYLSEHLAERELNILTVCRHFGISRSTLYTVCRNAFGMGLSERLRQMRLQRAMELLPEQHNLTEIAEMTGFADPDYMGKLIKKQTGIPAKKLQKRFNDKK